MVLFARATPVLIASSKLLGEDAMISVTFTTDMVCVLIMVSNGIEIFYFHAYYYQENTPRPRPTSGEFDSSPLGGTQV